MKTYQQLLRRAVEGYDTWDDMRRIDPGAIYEMAAARWTEEYAKSLWPHSPAVECRPALFDALWRIAAPAAVAAVGAVHGNHNETIQAFSRLATTLAQIVAEHYSDDIEGDFLQVQADFRAELKHGDPDRAYDDWRDSQLDGRVA